MRSLSAVSGKDISCRRIGAGDRRFLEGLFTSARERMFAGSDIPAAMKERILQQQFAAQHESYHAQHPHADYELILIGGAPAGRIYVDRGEEGIDLMEITLLPEHRNRGIGTLMVRKLQEEAVAAGKPIRLFVEHWNPEARRLYERLGFRETEDIGTHWKMAWEAGQS